VPAALVYGVGAGFATAQLSNLTMAEIPASAGGVAAGVNNTMRQAGASLGIALVGSAFSSGARPAVAVTMVAVLLGALTALRIPGRAVQEPGDPGHHPTGAEPVAVAVP
jgi:hypothetical protein